MTEENFRIPKIKEHIVLREEYDDWAILYNPDTGKAVGLSPTGVAVWKSLAKEGEKDATTIVEALREEFQDLPDDPTSDVTDFLREIVSFGYAEEG